MLDGPESARMQRRAEKQVIDLRKLVVDVVDEVVVDGSDRQRACGRVAGQVVGVRLAVK